MYDIDFESVDHLPIRAVSHVQKRKKICVIYVFSISISMSRRAVGQRLLISGDKDVECFLAIRSSTFLLLSARALAIRSTPSRRQSRPAKNMYRAQVPLLCFASP
jgi:hypothetical protein